MLDRFDDDAAEIDDSEPGDDGDGDDGDPSAETEEEDGGRRRRGRRRGSKTDAAADDLRARRLALRRRYKIQDEIGSASCRERGCRYVSNRVVAVYLNKTTEVQSIMEDSNADNH